jgi:hypothetical protein
VGLLIIQIGRIGANSRWLLRDFEWEVLTADFADGADVSWLVNPAGEKFEPTHVGCYGISSGGF